MIQRFIELGEGYSDLYELIELTKANKERLVHMMALNTKKLGKDVTSLVIILKPTEVGDFQPLYICREGIPNSSKRYQLFTDLANELGRNIIEFEVKPSTIFAEKELYYQHLIGILRMNHIIPPMQ